METRLTVPVSADNFETAKQQIKAAAKAGAEMLELRTDYLKQLSTDIVKKLIADAKAIAKLPLIVTCRDEKEGGVNNYPLKLRMDILITAAEAGAEFIDLEYTNFLATENRQLIERALAEHPHCKLIVSAHDFKHKFQNIGKLYRDIETLYPAAIPKLVYTANHINDCFEAFDLLEAKRKRAIIFCMGHAGLISRIIAKKLGSLVTYASIDEKSATAPGQLTIDEFKNLYRYDDIKIDTQLYGVIADPVGHSLSPHIHNACFAAAGVNKLYLPLWVQGGSEQFDEFMEHILSRKYLDFAGFSITIPHKTNALEFTKAKFGFVEPLTEKIGAANTLLVDSRAMSDERRIRAYNTDYAGAIDAITSAMSIERAELKDIPAAVIGAGGVARTITAGLADAGAKIRIYNRTVKKAGKLAAEFNCSFAGLDELKTLDAKLLINCTSIGMYPKVDETALNGKYLKKIMVVFDTVYNPAETLLLKQAKKLGCKTISGLDMFINQANSQFKLFTNQPPDTNLMRKIVTQQLNR